MGLFIPISELKNKVFLLKRELSHLNIKIWDTSSYSYEIDGDWNVVFSINYNDINYMYILFIKNNKIYGSPFINIEYIKYLKQNSFLENPMLLNILENKLLKIMGYASKSIQISNKNNISYNHNCVFNSKIEKKITRGMIK